MQGEIEMAAYAYAKAVDDGEKIVVGVNRFTDEAAEPAEVFPIDPALQRPRSSGPGRCGPSATRRRSTPPWPTWTPRPGGPRTSSSRCARPSRRMATLGEVSDVLRERLRGLPARRLTPARPLGPVDM